MIDPKELRIGNMVKTTLSKFRGELFTIIAISSLGVCYSDSMIWIEWKDLKPISLSPEILDKCGFNAGSVDGQPFYSLIINEHRFFLDKTDAGLLFSNSPWNTPILFLHQLQNLYYALTGEELNVQL